MRAVAFGDVELDLDEILLGAVADGSWERLRAQLARGIAAQQAGGRLDLPALRGAEETFRRRHNLLAAEDLGNWLDDRKVTVSDWRAHLQRLLLGESGIESPVDGEPLAEAARIAVAVEGLVGESGLRLLSGAAASGPPPGVDGDDAAALALRAAGDSALPLEERSADGLRARAIRVLHLRALLDLERAAVEPRLIREMIAAQTLERTELRYDAVELRSESAAREVVFCLLEEGEDLGDVAARAGVPVVRCEVAGGDAGPQLLGAVAGEPLGPLAGRDGRWCVQVLRERIAPDTDDPEVWNRVRDSIVEEALERRLAGRVHWYVPV